MRVQRYAIAAPLLHVGDKVKFSAERLRYTVRAVSADGRFAICTKPFNPKRTVLYTIVDFDSNVRGPDNRVFSLGYETDEDIATNLADLEAGRLEVSVRHDLRLDIARIDHVDCELAS